MTKFLRRLAVVTALAALALAVPAAGARADESGPAGDEGPKTVARYVSCAAGLAGAFNVSSGVVAFMACVKIFFDELPN